MKSNMDFYSDRNKSVLAAISMKVDIPEDVLHKNAYEELPDDLSDNSFGDPANKLWPVTSRSDTWLSIAYFSKTASCNYPGRARVKETLRKAARLWEIPFTEVKKLEENLTDPVPKAASEQVVPAAEQAKELLENATRFTFATRMGHAEKILKTAEESGEVLDPATFQALERMAAMGKCSKTAAEKYITEIAEDSRHEVAGELRKLAAEIEDNMLDSVMVSPLHIAKITCAADILLRKSAAYLDDAPRPEDTLFRATESLEKFIQSESLRTTCGRWISKSAAEKDFDNLAAGMEEMGMDRPDTAHTLCQRLQELTPVQVSRLDDCAGVPFITL